jgi:hypothetical protein
MRLVRKLKKLNMQNFKNLYFCPEQDDKLTGASSLLLLLLLGVQCEREQSVVLCAKPCYLFVIGGIQGRQGPGLK